MRRACAPRSLLKRPAAAAAAAAPRTAGLSVPVSAGVAPHSLGVRASPLPETPPQGPRFLRAPPGEPVAATAKRSRRRKNPGAPAL
ncbi:hypothetical protein MHYP_G00143180 [Metynnis hypsauchen]